MLDPQSKGSVPRGGEPARPAAPSPRPTVPSWRAAAILIAVAAAAFADAQAGVLGLPPPLAKAIVLVALAVAGWGSGRLPAHIVSLTFFVVAILLSVAPPEVVLSGFTSTAFWLIFGGQAMGIAIQQTGLAQRIADATTRALGSRSYPVVIGGLVVLGTILSFLMPSSMGRTVLLLPIASAMADGYGFHPGRRGRTGVLLATVFGTTAPSFSILPSNVPNAVLAGAAESYWHVSLGYFEYLLLHFPVLGLFRAVLLVPAIVLLYPDHLASRPHEAARPAPLSRAERTVAVILGLALVLWATDFVHHISPAWISLAAGLVMMWPGARLVGPRAFNEQMNYGSLFFVAGVIGMGAVISHSGLGALLGSIATRVLPLAPGATARNFASIAVMGTLLGPIATSPGVVAVMTPFAGQLAAATGFSLKAVLMLEVLGFSNILLPYQQPPLLVATQLSSLSLRATARVAVTMTVLSLFLIYPLDFLWLRLLGWLGP